MPNPIIDPKILSSLDQQLSRVSFRKAFAHDPINALQQAGIDHTKLPAGVVDGLAELSLDELHTLARVNAKVKAASGNGDTNGYVVF